MDISPMMDRHNASVEKSQVSNAAIPRDRIKGMMQLNNQTTLAPTFKQKLTIYSK